ncbi:hypothetical protein CAPTEDRAFT_189004 [Capitella teleta]|uniref:Nucleotide-diphospho-sugar transferase domain-containing protein n=1 Tax=Capitella teleta TaxID=283909 RepID=R7UKR9_CAPTE|nr:hypothetical protein CAPTEDRAFT_189004 [Capitella teleta]|eukprot:ELU07109.1 hypothetical protein CAPTEDRAFT_189004 [Capitella teleta]
MLFKYCSTLGSASRCSCLLMAAFVSVLLIIKPKDMTFGNVNYSTLKIGIPRHVANNTPVEVVPTSPIMKYHVLVGSVGENTDMPKLTLPVQISDIREDHTHQPAHETKKMYDIDRNRTGPSNQTEFTSYLSALDARANADKDIILAYVDFGARDMAINFYITALFVHEIDNYLFITSSPRMSDELHERDIPCLLYTKNSASDEGSVYGTSVFKQKMNIRTFMVLEALEYGFNVLHTDVDIHYYANPLPVVRRLCDARCDVAPLWDSFAYNAGFVYVRSSPMSIKLYHHMKVTALTTDLDDQKALNKAAEAMFRKGLRLMRLPEGQFQSGFKFFEQGRHMFAGDRPCHHCIAIHNNWIMTIEAKEYRLKEMHLWMLDDDQYYSSTSRKYLTYENTRVIAGVGSAAHMRETKALENALAIGQLLNRTVILPRFACERFTGCPMNTAFMISSFDAQFNGKYRESTFLRHPLVPEVIKNSISQQILIKTSADNSKLEIGMLSEVYIPMDVHSGATSSEIVRWFSGKPESVLRFRTLYDAFGKFTDSRINAEFKDRTRAALVRGNTRQLTK